MDIDIRAVGFVSTHRFRIEKDGRMTAINLKDIAKLKQQLNRSHKSEGAIANLDLSPLDDKSEIVRI